MTDSDLDSVAAGISLKDVLAVLTLTDEQILSHPSYGAAKASAIASVKGLSESQQGALRTQIGLLFPVLSEEDQGQVRRLAPAELQFLLPTPK